MTAASQDTISLVDVAARPRAKLRIAGWFRGFRWTIGRRLTLAMLITVSLGVVALAAALVAGERERAVAQAVRDSGLSHRLMATEAAAAVHLRERAMMQRRVATFIQAFE